MNYRTEIDGLRALAVLPVILFHADIGVVGGGYVGVDIFFVISGYLITGIILKDLQEGAFSVVGFYERRARRILPALFLVLLAMLPFAASWMLSNQIEDFSAALISVILFSSNILFWRTESYFAPDSALNPLLHTWSLAVEEQFYILFPLLMMLIWRRWRGRMLHLILLLFAGSFILSEIGWRNDATANFYLAPTRAWELLAGALCAFARNGAPQRRSEALSLLGLGLIVFAIFAYDERTPFPSFYALAPVGGAALIIHFGAAGTLVARLLSTGPFVGLGLISYSAYLWHQPIFAFARIRTGLTPDPALMLGLIGVIVTLAYLSWKYVEQPFRIRRGAGRFSRRAIFSLSALGGLSFVLIGAAGYLSDGARAFFDEPLRRIDDVARESRFQCGDDSQFKTCLIGAGAPHIALIGDSHARALAPALGPVLAARGAGAQVYVGPWCAPLLELHTSDPEKNAKSCRRNVTPTIESAIRDPEVTTIILFAEWANYALGYRPGGLSSAYSFRDRVNDDPTGNPTEFALAAEHTAKRVINAGKTLIVVLPVPEYGFAVPNALGRVYATGGDPSILDMPEADYLTRNSEVLETFASLPPEVRVADPRTALCESGVCRPYAPGFSSLYFDSNHLSHFGAELVAPLIAAAALEPAPESR